MVRKHGFLLLLLLAVSACGPSGGEHGGHGAFGMHHLALPLMSHALRLGLREARPRGFRRACADDIARFCPTARSRREERQCIEAKRNEVSQECRTALDARRNRGNRPAQ
jgi:hypothetical protein